MLLTVFNGATDLKPSRVENREFSSPSLSFSSHFKAVASALDTETEGNEKLFSAYIRL